MHHFKSALKIPHDSNSIDFHVEESGFIMMRVCLAMARSEMWKKKKSVVGDTE